MSLISYILIFSVILLEISGEEKFCAKDRPLPLGGVFNYENIIFAYSWKEVNGLQYWLVWRYEVKDNHLVPIGKDTSVNQVFPGIDIFRAGFGLTMKCDKADTKCQSYQKLVFIFFQTKYKVFRFENNNFKAVADKSNIPWGLKNVGEATDWFFGNTDMDNIYSVVFLSGDQNLFVVSNSYLFVTSISINAISLKWRKLTENKVLVNALGGFAVGPHLFININEAPDSSILKYDQTGKQMSKNSVWKYFKCDNTEEDNEIFETLDRVNGPTQSDNTKYLKVTDESLAIILLICIFVAIIIVDIIVGAFWLSVYVKNKNSSEV